jgi:hypothetical protein
VADKPHTSVPATKVRGPDTTTRAGWTIATTMMLVAITLLTARATWVGPHEDRLADIAAAWAVTLGTVAMVVVFMQVDDPLTCKEWLGIQDSLGPALGAILDPGRRVCMAARPHVWRRCGYAAAILWAVTIAAAANVAVGGLTSIPEPVMILAVMVVMFPCGGCTAVATLGPARSRAQAEYDRACAEYAAARRQQEKERELRALEEIDPGSVESLKRLKGAKHVLQTIAAIQGLIEVGELHADRASPGAARADLHVVNGTGTHGRTVSHP